VTPGSMRGGKTTPAADPSLDLVLERVIDVPRRLVWEAWTRPEHLKEWFCPKPWGVSECEIDLRPGGVFRTTMRSPEGQDVPNVGCYLEVVPLERLVFTSALLSGYRPSGRPAVHGHRHDGAPRRRLPYVATALHRDEAGRDKHKAMGFHEGWGKALDQLVALVKALPAG
jgi:uncharacterized protein YndB with AHSA1/START domain